LRCGITDEKSGCQKQAENDEAKQNPHLVPPSASIENRRASMAAGLTAMFLIHI
jgi:hypothetical protein